MLQQWYQKDATDHGVFLVFSSLSLENIIYSRISWQRCPKYPGSQTHVSLKEHLPYSPQPDEPQKPGKSFKSKIDNLCAIGMRFTQPKMSYSYPLMYLKAP